ncbi:hypothetical protein [Arcobacter sp. FWKO B]|uniref:hypothetical protein n=1 Tax=Arcobacter sp. FWKO B TaxID=2593672 RepID=UPI0018A5D19D|nr:hypothetical protein [Arcobacter sp. FWKO B]QOG12894.1 hypothetical protein FWKOB_09400 [Arcobacter sp. FWKO B]
MMHENRLFEALLDVIPFRAYAVDIETYEVVYANKLMRENLYSPQDTHCWKKVFGQEEVCSWCSVLTLQQREKKNKNEKHTSEFFDESDDKWLKSYDELISWPDGRDVKYSILVDISDQKEIQGNMIKAHATLAMNNKQISLTNKNLQITKLELQKSVNQNELKTSNILNILKEINTSLETITQSKLDDSQKTSLENIKNNIKLIGEFIKN